MTNPLQQLLAASAVIVTLERICSSGILSEADEAQARLIICRACRAFEIPTVAERADPPAALKSIRSNANCFDDKVAVATMPLIFDIATRAIRGVLSQPSGVARAQQEPGV